MLNDEQLKTTDSPQAQPPEAELKPCPWCGTTTDTEDEWGSLITHKPICYWRTIHGDPIGRVRVNNSDKERWNTRADLPRATVDEIPARLEQIKAAYSGTADESATYRVKANDLAWLINEVELRIPRATVDDKAIRQALRPIRGCATDDQYVDVFERVTALVSAPRATEGELTVEQALKELREMFPGSCPHIEFNDYRPISGGLVVSVNAGGLELGNAATLNAAMSRARKWAKSRDKGEKS
jgi:hypothetical protein